MREDGNVGGFRRLSLYRIQVYLTLQLPVHILNVMVQVILNVYLWSLYLLNDLWEKADS